MKARSHIPENPLTGAPVVVDGVVMILEPVK